MAKYVRCFVQYQHLLTDCWHTYISFFLFPHNYSGRFFFFFIFFFFFYRGRVVTSTYGLRAWCTYVICQKIHHRKAKLDKHSMENSNVLPGINACGDKHWDFWLTPSWTMFLLEVKFVLILQFEFISAPFCVYKHR